MGFSFCVLCEPTGKVTIVTRPTRRIQWEYPATRRDTTFTIHESRDSNLTRRPVEKSEDMISVSRAAVNKFMVGARLDRAGCVIVDE